MEPQKNSPNGEEEITTIPELARMINNGFQSNQEYMDKKFNELKGEISEVEIKLTREIRGVDKKLDGFVERYDEEKLPMRVEYMENMLNVPKK